MNDLQIFSNPEFGEIRTVTIDNEPWFVGKDVAGVLGYGGKNKNSKALNNAVADHVDEEDKGVTKMETPGGKQDIVVINESGLYSLIMNSKLPTAKKFKHWVTAEVLPSIRKHGAYMTPETLEAALLNPDTMIRILTDLKEAKSKNMALQVTNSALTVENAIMAPKADYFDELVDRKLNTGIRETAKQLNTPQNAFVSFLLDKKYIYRDKKGKLQPYQQYASNGLFELKECINEKTGWGGTQLLITPKGRETFRLLFAGASKTA